MARLKVWAAGMEALIGKFRALEPAPGAFDLCPGSRVLDPKLFHEKLLQDVEDGAGGPRAMIGALEKDLADYLAVRS